MASRCCRPSLLLPLLLLLLPLLATPTTEDDFHRKRLGQLGKHYNMERGVPYIQCEGFNTTSDERSELHCGPGQQIFFSKKFGCNAVIKFKNMTKFKYTDTIEATPDDYDREVAGCWHGGEIVHQQCLFEDKCVAFIRPDESWNGLGFCCCNTHNCNMEVIVKFDLSNGSEVGTSEEPSWPHDYNSTSQSILPEGVSPALVIFLVVAFFLLFFAVLLFCICRHAGAKPWLRAILKGKEQKVSDVQKMDEAVPLVGLMGNGMKRNNLKSGLVIGDVLAQGKFALVRHGRYTDPTTGTERPVAIKMIKDQKVFIVEESAYRETANSHDHLAHYIGACAEEENHLYYLVLEHYENGCLENYLKDTTFTPLEALTFLCSFMDGLSFLHGPATLPSGANKFPIVHRDIKSRNVLVKADGTAAIADFGLAIVCTEYRTNGRHYQVGTHRYMSPELLAGMANLNMDGLRQADVYAASLITWETLNRTLIDSSDEVMPAEVPYESEVKEAEVAHEKKFLETRSPREEFVKMPIQYYLKKIVFNENRRPTLRERLKENQITKELCRTTLDMWDFEVDGRITAACAHARLSQLRKDAIAGTIPQPQC